MSLLIEEYDALHEAWHDARRRGTPLNTFVTLHPAGINDLTPDERWKLWRRILKKLNSAVPSWPCLGFGLEMHPSGAKPLTEPSREGLLLFRRSLVFRPATSRFGQAALS